MLSVVSGLLQVPARSSFHLQSCSFSGLSNLFLVGDPPAPVPCVAGKRPLDLPFGVLARDVLSLPLHLSPYSQEY